jgi:hypothetical protein
MTSRYPSVHRANDLIATGSEAVDESMAHAAGQRGVIWTQLVG